MIPLANWPLHFFFILSPYWPPHRIDPYAYAYYVSLNNFQGISGGHHHFAQLSLAGRLFAEWCSNISSLTHDSQIIQITHRVAERFPTTVPPWLPTWFAWTGVQPCALEYQHTHLLHLLWNSTTNSYRFMAWQVRNYPKLPEWITPRVCVCSAIEASGCGLHSVYPGVCPGEVTWRVMDFATALNSVRTVPIKPSPRSVIWCDSREARSEFTGIIRAGNA